jgi:SAM-dependent methyltransferase
VSHDPESAAAFFDDYGEREWTRFEDDRTPSTSLDVHVEYLRRFVRKGDRVLDVGAGPGRFTIELARIGATVVVADISPGQLELNRSKLVEAGAEASVAERIVADVVELPFDEGSFDAAVCYGGPISYAVDRAGEAIAELARVTRPGGLLLVSVMSLVGAVQAYADAVLVAAEKHGVALMEEIVATGLLPEGPDLGHLAMRLFRWRELEELLGRHGEIVAASATGLLRPTQSPEDSGLRALLRRVELELAAEPGALDCGPHMLAVVRR